MLFTLGLYASGDLDRARGMMFAMSKKNGKDRHVGEMERKFADFDRMLTVAKRDGVQIVLVPSPQTLGDTYEELIRNLTKLQEAELSLVIVPKSKPKK
jgi:hypothetical protein